MRRWLLILVVTAAVLFLSCHYGLKLFHNLEMWG